jgi:hypothetical protein
MSVRPPRVSVRPLFAMRYAARMRQQWLLSLILLICNFVAFPIAAMNVAQAVWNLFVPELSDQTTW